jgi:hypothetical protein
MLLAVQYQVSFLLITSIDTNFLPLSHGTNKNSEKKTVKYKTGKIPIARTRKIKSNF